MRSLWWLLVIANAAVAVLALYLLRYGSALDLVMSVLMLLYALLNLLYVLLVRPGSSESQR